MPRKSYTETTKPIATADLPNLVDVCADEQGKPIFLFLDDWTLSEQASTQIDGVSFVPPPRDSMPWQLPRASEVIKYFHCDNDRKLFDDIEAVIFNNSELPDRNLYPFLAAWVLHTHLIEKVNYSPILTFYAVASKGKTRTCRVLLSMARRGIHVETLREADIIRKSERFTCSFFFDVLDVWKKAERLGAEDILLCRFDRGVKIPRVTKPEVNGFGDTQHFSCFGPTLIATNEPAHRILDSRGIVVAMRQATRKFDNDPREPDFVQLRERATAFRARWIQKELPEVNKPSCDRLGDILRPIAQMFAAIVSDRQVELQTLVKTFEGERADALADTYEGELVKVLLDLEDAVEAGKIETRQIAVRLNEGKKDHCHITSYTIGKRMAALGFKATKVGGQRGYFYDSALLNKLADQYGHAPQNCVLSVTNVEVIDNAEIYKGQKEDATGETHSETRRPRTDRTDGTDFHGVHENEWNGETVERYAETFTLLSKSQSIIEKSEGDAYTPEPDLPEGF